MNAQAFATPTLDHVIVDGALRVLIEQDTGKVAAVQCAKTGCAAQFLFSRGDIQRAALVARNAWQSTADLA
jgi:hypothetical protein